MKLLVLALISLALFSCSGGKGDGFAPSTIEMPSQAPAEPLVISPSTISLSLSGAQSFTTSGGTPPITFSVVSGGGSIDTSGLFTAPAVPATCTIRATDALGQTSDATVNVYGALGISPALRTVAVNNTIAFSAGGGVSPYSYSVFSGGGSINSSTGFFTAAATPGSVTVRVTDSIGNFSDSFVTVNSALQISPTSQLILVGQNISFSTTGGVSPISYSILSGVGSVDSGSGLYTAPGSNGNAVVRATDSYGNTSDANVTVTTTLTLSPASVTLAVNNSQTFTGSGGTPPLVYSIVSGGGTINSSTGAYTAGASSGSAVVRVTDSLGATADSSVTINPALAISPTSVTTAVNGSSTFSASGGVAPYTFSVISGSGLINSSTGEYTAPALAGTDTVRVTDSFGNTADATVTINNSLGINPSAVTLAVTNTRTFTGLSGVPPYTFSIVSGGGTINSSSGFFTAPGTAGSVTVQVTDSASSTADATVTVNPALQISPSTKSLAVNNVFTFTASGGVTPYTYSIVSGGGSINSSTGAYTAPASSGSATVRVTDGYGNTSNATVTINNALAISPASDTITVVDTLTFTSSGGVSPYTYSIESGSGSINSSTGLYTPSGAGSITIRTTDSVGNTSDAELTVNTALAIVPSTAYAQVSSDFTFDITGGVPPVTYSVVAGSGSFADTSIGVYSAAASTGSATVRVTDAMGHTSDAAVTIYNPLMISPETWTMAINTTRTFVGSGGVGALSFSMVSGTGSINSSTGLYTAPISASSESVQVTDTIGNTAVATITVVSSLTISPQTLKLPVFSTNTFSSILGTAPYTYSVVSGGGTINSSTGLYTAPSTTGAGVARSTDAGANTSDATITHIKPVEIVSGSYHTCARYNEGSVKCWGDASSGQLGSGSTADLGDAASEGGGGLPFVNLGTGRTATELAAGILHTCARLDNGSVKCWGSNTYGQLGYGNTTTIGSAANQMGDNLAAVNLGTGRTATKIYAFGYMSCARLDNGAHKCWGRNTYGQLALGDVNHRGDAANEMGDNLLAINFGTGRTATKLTGGMDFMCALLDNASVKCYGRANNGQLGSGGTANLGDGVTEVGDGVPVVSLGTGLTVVELASGYSHSCVILNNSTLKCWGRNQSGQLGKGSTTTLGDATTEMGNNLTAVSLGTGFVPSKVWGLREATCVQSVAGVLKCFGLNSSGQLLQGNTTTRGDGAGEMGDSLVASNPGTGFTISSISTGYYFGCMITSTDRIKCWGSALNGELLNASTTSHLGDAGGELGNSLPFVNH